MNYGDNEEEMSEGFLSGASLGRESEDDEGGGIGVGDDAPQSEKEWE